jgi:hypothetical protein
MTLYKLRELERAAYIRGDVELAKLYARLYDLENMQ